MGAQRHEADKAFLTLHFSWQRLLAALCFGVALLVLGYGLARPKLSAYLGRQVSESVAAEVADVVAAGLLGPPSAASSTDGPAPVVTPAPGAPPAQPDAGSVAGAVIAQLRPTEDAGVVVVASGQAESEPAVAAAGQVEPEPAVAAGGQVETEPAVAAGAPVEAPAAPLPTAVPEAAAAQPTPLGSAPVATSQPERSVVEIIEDLPSGEITVTEEKLNSKIAARVASMAPIEGIVVRFVPGEVQVTLTVFGQETLASSGLTVKGGRVAVLQPALNGPLSLLISAADLVRPIEEELNNTLELADREVRDVRIEQGQIVVMLD